MCFPPLVRSNFLILMNLLFFLPYFRRNSLFQWLIFFGHFWSKFPISVNCFFHVYPLLISMNCFGRNSLFQSMNYVFSSSVRSKLFSLSFASLFRSKLSVLSVHFSFLRLFPSKFWAILCPPPDSRRNSFFRFFFPSAFFATKFRPDRKYHFFTSYSRQNSVFSEIYCFPVLFKPKFDEIRFFFWRFICFPAFPWNFLIVAIYFFAALFSFIRVKTPYFGDLFVILYFSTLSFFLQFLGKTPK